MAPWDENAWFNSPKVSFVNVDNTGAVTIVKGDINRVGLIISFSGGGTQAWVLPDVGIQPTSNNGIQLVNTQPVLSLTQQFYGSLVTLPWLCISAAVPPAKSQLTVVEVSLSDWPKGNINEQLQRYLAQIATQG